MVDPKERPLRKLHPTQLTVGMLEVRDKKLELEKLTPDQRPHFMRAHPVPAVLGPEGTLFVTDHHHLCRAALEAGVDAGFVQVMADLSSGEADRFWEEMDARGWVHPLDENGVRHRYSAIPRRLEDLVDDVYRSLARYVRAAGGYEKSEAAFAEFVWADFFRRLIPIEDVRADFAGATTRAVKLSHGTHAERMPGYIASGSK